MSSHSSSVINIPAFTDDVLRGNGAVTKGGVMGAWGMFPVLKKEGNYSPRRLQCGSTAAYSRVL